MPNFDPYFKDAYCRICDMKMIDLISSIPLHNFDKMAYSLKKFISKTTRRERWEKKASLTAFIKHHNRKNIIFSACFASNFSGSNCCKYTIYISERFNFIWKLENNNFRDLQQRSYCFNVSNRLCFLAVLL